MPIYEYQCTDCSFRYEQIQKISDALLVECPSCGKDSMKKLISAVAFRLKGKGWYETDFKSGNKRNVTDQAGSHKEDSPAKQDNATQSKDGDTKPTGKTETTETTNKPPTQSGAKSTTASNSE